jgi:hypothetical protein
MEEKLKPDRLGVGVRSLTLGMHPLPEMRYRQGGVEKRVI